MRILVLLATLFVGIYAQRDNDFYDNIFAKRSKRIETYAKKTRKHFSKFMVYRTKRCRAGRWGSRSCKKRCPSFTRDQAKLNVKVRRMVIENYFGQTVSVASHIDRQLSEAGLSSFSGAMEKYDYDSFDKTMQDMKCDWKIQIDSLSVAIGGKPSS